MFIFIGDCWVHKKKACVHGHNVRQFHEKTVDECKVLCDAEPNCEAFEYSVWYGGNNPYTPRECTLQNGNDPIGCNGEQFNMDLYVKNASCSLGKFCLE